MSSSINLGVRHILLIYPMLAVIGGYGISALLLLAKRRWRPIAVVPNLLVFWIVADSWAARPDYLACLANLSARIRNPSYANPIWIGARICAAEAGG
jgi:hypothetical protein